MEIELPDGTVLDAPDDADPSAVAKAYLANQQPKQRTWGEQIKRDLGLTARTGLNAVAALPMMAADFGVAARNLFPGQNYELPSSMWKRGLTDMGLPEPEGFREKASMALGEMAVGGRLPIPTGGTKAGEQAISQVPSTFTPQATVRANTLNDARNSGLVVPPSSSNPTTTNRLLESLGGKVATQQDASMHNQVVANGLANRALGRPEGAQITQGAMQDLRKRVAEASYGPVRGLGTMRLDAKFEQALDDVTAAADKVAKQYPELANANLTKTIQSLKSKSIDSDTAVDTIQLLRDRASDAYAKGDKEAGKAYKAVAGAFEDAIERSLQRRGSDAGDVLSAFREGRKLMAKSFSVEKAINEGTGNVSIKKLSQQLAKGKPLSGELDTLARFGQAFPKAAQEITDSPVSNTDIMFSAGVAALSGQPAALAYPFGRQGARALLLSPQGQRLATPSMLQDSPRTATSLLYGTNSLLGE